MKNLRSVVIGAVAMAGVTATLAFAGSLGSDDGPTLAGKTTTEPVPTTEATAAALSSASNMTYEDATLFRGWSLYDTGLSFGGHALTDMLRRNDPATYDSVSRQEGTGGNYVSWLYGTCAPTGTQGCPVPLEIQVWPKCSRSFSGSVVDADTNVSVSLPADERLTVRGVPAAFYDEWSRLEIPTGDSIIVLFGDSRSQLLSAAAALRGVNNSRGVGSALPAPAAC